MKHKSRAFGVWGTVSVLTLMLYVFGGIPAYPARAIPIIWVFISWNLYAYGFEKRMWPTQFVELHGQDKGEPGWREFWFWFSAFIYLIFLATVAWAK
ncbi:hypothetical protein [Hydrogenophaga sp.]|uniref:hypothetical protein n=1 Tax=Hydrogenophaga sp. TaxID=1904254 RepID=UPI002FC93E1E